MMVVAILSLLFNEVFPTPEILESPEIFIQALPRGQLRSHLCYLTTGGWQRLTVLEYPDPTRPDHKKRGDPKVAPTR